MTDDVNNIIKEVDEEWEKGEGGGWQSFWLLIKPAALPPFFFNVPGGRNNPANIKLAEEYREWYEEQMKKEEKRNDGI